VKASRVGGLGVLHSTGIPPAVNVTFATWRPVVEWLGGVRRVRFGEPSWARVGDEELARLIGGDDLDG
jgi:hypothetical protein